MTRVLVLYYSSWGHIEAMAQAEADGAREVEGVEATVKRVAESAPSHVVETFRYKTDHSAPILADPLELKSYDGIIFGTPTRFGNMAAQMKNFIDQTGPLWREGALAGKVGGVFTSSASQHGGQETTITSFHIVLLHHGMLIAGMPPSFQGMNRMDEITGGSHYGASTLSAPDGRRFPSDNELAGARAQGRSIASIAKKLKG